MLWQQVGDAFSGKTSIQLKGEAQRKIRTFTARAMTQCLSQMVGAEGFEPPTLKPTVISCAIFVVILPKDPLYAVVRNERLRFRGIHHRATGFTVRTLHQLHEYLVGINAFGRPKVFRV